MDEVVTIGQEEKDTRTEGIARGSVPKVRVLPSPDDEDREAAYWQDSSAPDVPKLRSEVCDDRSTIGRQMNGMPPVWHHMREIRDRIERKIEDLDYRNPAELTELLRGLGLVEEVIRDIER